MTDLTPSYDPQWNDQTEDYVKGTWDFHRTDGSPIDTLEELSDATGADAGQLARDLIRLPWGRSAPRKLIEEALTRV